MSFDLNENSKEKNDQDLIKETIAAMTRGAQVVFVDDFLFIHCTNLSIESININYLQIELCLAYYCK